MRPNCATTSGGSLDGEDEEEIISKCCCSIVVVKIDGWGRIGRQLDGGGGGWSDMNLPKIKKTVVSVYVEFKQHNRKQTFFHS